MVHRNPLPPFDGDFAAEDLDSSALDVALHTAEAFQRNDIVVGTIRQIRQDGVVVDIGCKSEGFVRLDDWREDGGDLAPLRIGDSIQVVLETVEEENGFLKLSYRKARQQAAWETLLATHKEGNLVSGVVKREIKGGLLVDIGVTAFLPTSQVDIRRPTSLGDYVGKSITCTILKIDVERRHVIVSRRRSLSTGTPMNPGAVLEGFAPGQIRKGVVKNIAEFGAFVDLGGIDGLLHVTDMSWGRVSNPHDVVKLDQELEVYIIAVDRAKEKVSLGLKQKTPSPWLQVEQRYPVDSRQRGRVVALMPYGAFVELEAGVVGLVHISEMVGDPKQTLKVDQEIDVRILNINRDKQEISLGMKPSPASPPCPGPENS